MFNSLKGDKVLWGILAFLAIFSFLPVFSASSNLAFRIAEGNVIPYLMKHLLILVMGIVIIIYLQFFNFKYFSRLSQIGIFVSIVLLFVTLLFGVNKGNASRWIMGFQPSDFAKLVLIIYVSRMLTNKKEDIKDFKKGLIPILWPVALICGLILPGFEIGDLKYFFCKNFFESSKSSYNNFHGFYLFSFSSISSKST